MLSDPPELPDIDVVVRYRPAGEGTEVGGDWHDVFHLADAPAGRPGPTRAGPPDGGIAVVVGDVAGHDVTAATVMGQVRSMLRGFTVHDGGRPDETLAALDHAIRHTRLTPLATCILMHVRVAADPSSGLDLMWSNAGHPAPILLDPSGTTTVLAEPHDHALGFSVAAARSSSAHLLPPGSTLLLFSDGLFERRTIDYDESFERLRHAASTLAGLTIDALCDELLLSAPRDDDVVIIALRQR
jgi:serine phosphatase RsbU (regulator of sigma subunit)